MRGRSVPKEKQAEEREKRAQRLLTCGKRLVLNLLWNSAGARKLTE